MRYLSFSLLAKKLRRAFAAPSVIQTPLLYEYALFKLTPRPAQLALSLPKPKATHGGAREGAGRPRKPGAISHARRPEHKARNPLHVTVRSRGSIGSLRRHRVAAAIGRRLRALAADERFATRRESFRVVHFSIQPDHLHLIVEAESAQALSRGMQGLLTHTAHAVNRRLQRRGKLFAHRYHARELRTPLEVRRVIAYVLTNAAKHAGDDPIPDLGTWVTDGIDPCSSARWFSGWERPPPPQSKPCPVSEPKTWLLNVGWKRHGLLRRDERPAGVQA